MDQDNQNYTSKKFGMNKFQKLNQELTDSLSQLKSEYDALKSEFDTLKMTYNGMMIQKSEKVLEADHIESTMSKDITVLKDSLDESIKKYMDLESVLKLTRENLELVKNELTRERELKIESEKKHTSLIASYNELKLKYKELDELYNKKVVMNENFETTVSELSNQINLKNKLHEKQNEELNAIKRQMIDYRDQNATYRKHLSDKDSFIVGLNARISDLTRNVSEEENQRGSGTPRVTTYTDPIEFSVGVNSNNVSRHRVANRDVAKSGREVVKNTRI